jgi:hypothetical protein
MKKISFLWLIIILASGLFAQDEKVPFTLADRDRMIRVEVQFDAMNTKMDAKFEAMDAKFEAINTKIDANNQRISDQQDLLFWGFTILFGLLLFMLGYNIWDRRTIIAPIKERQDKIIQILKEAEEDNHSIREAFRRASLW